MVSPTPRFATLEGLHFSPAPRAVVLLRPIDMAVMIGPSTLYDNKEETACEERGSGRML